MPEFGLIFIRCVHYLQLLLRLIQEYHYSPRMSAKQVQVYLLLLVSAVGCVGFVLAGLTVFSEQLNMFVFNQKHVINDRDKAILAKTLCVWVGTLLFILATSVMVLRVSTGKLNASTGVEPKAISAINRILTNTLEQSAIFACLYGAILLNEGSAEPAIRGDKILVLASLFVIGRLLYAVGYIIGAATEVMSFRSFGFGVSVILNIVMVAYHIGFDVFGLLDHYVTPAIKSYIR